MTDEHLRFTDEQVAAMRASVGVLDIISETGRTHIPEDNPALDTQRSIALSNWMARRGVANRLIRSTLGDENSDISILADARAQKLTPFNKEDWAASFVSSAYTPYHELTITFAGLINVRVPRSDINYHAYRIHKPDTSVHGLGLVIASNLIGHRTIGKLEDGSNITVTKKNHHILDVPSAQSLVGMLQIAILMDSPAAS